MIAKDENNNEWTLDDIRRGYRATPVPLLSVESYPKLSYGNDFALSNPGKLNRTRNSNTLVYNRVPKCASSTMQVGKNVLYGKLKKNPGSIFFVFVFYFAQKFAKIFSSKS